VDAASSSALVEAIAALGECAVLAPDFTILFEPGDLLVCAAAVLVSSVIEQRRDAGGKAHLILDTNINHFPNVLHYGNTPRVIFPSSGGAQSVSLSGNSCLGGDHIAELRCSDGPLPQRVVFDERGSYEYTQYNFFNGRFRPNVCLWDEASELIRCKVDGVPDLLAYWREEVAPFPEKYQSFHHFEAIARIERGLHYDHPDLRRVSSFELDPVDFAPPAALLQAFSAGFAKYGSAYGRSLGLPAAREAEAAFENRLVGRGEPYSPARVACTLGATNAIWLALEALLGGGLRRLLIPCPSYYQFAAVAAARGIAWSPIHRPLDPERMRGQLAIDAQELMPSVELIAEAIDRSVDVGAVALVTPGLPLGHGYSTEAVRFLAEKARAECWTLIVDETLRWLDYDGAGLDWSWLEASHPVVRVASVSKTFGLPGLRIGTLAVTHAGTRRPDTGEDIFERMAALADAAYSAPPAAHTPVLAAGLDLLTRFREGDRAGADVRSYADNLARLKERAAHGARILSEWRIPHVLPRAGASLVACLPKLTRCREQAEGFFRALVREQRLFLETGGHFSQNPAWPCTLARLGLGRESAVFEPDLVDFCRFYAAFSADTTARTLSERGSHAG
jgi:aspartate/methionine/tyrosine aminotransferase